LAKTTELRKLQVIRSETGLHVLGQMTQNEPNVIGSKTK